MFNILHQLVGAGQVAMQNTDYLVGTCACIHVHVHGCVFVHVQNHKLFAAAQALWFAKNRLCRMCLCVH